MLLTSFVFGISARARRCVRAYSLKNSLQRPFPACGVPSASTICAADIGRNNGVCSDAEISLLIADGQQPRISGEPFAMPLPQRGGRYIGLSLYPPVRFVPDFLFVCSNEMRDTTGSPRPASS